MNEDDLNETLNEFSEFTDDQPEQPPAPVADPLTTRLHPEDLARLADIIASKAQAPQQTWQPPADDSEPDEVDIRDLMYDRDAFDAYVRGAVNPQRFEQSFFTKMAAEQEIRDQFAGDLTPEEIKEICNKIRALDDVSPLQANAHMKEAYAVLGQKSREARNAPTMQRAPTLERSQSVEAPSAVPQSYLREYSRTYEQLTGQKPTMQQVREAYAEDNR